MQDSHGVPEAPKDRSEMWIFDVGSTPTPTAMLFLSPEALDVLIKVRRANPDLEAVKVLVLVLAELFPGEERVDPEVAHQVALRLGISELEARYSASVEYPILPKYRRLRWKLWYK